MRSRSFAMFVVAAMLLLAGRPGPVAAQSLTTGDITGTVTDPTGAVVSNAKVTLRSIESGASQVRSTNAQGAYRFPLLSPGANSVSVSPQDFNPSRRRRHCRLGRR
jgi:hypothetical protein